MNVTLLSQLAGVLRVGVILAIALHALALVPQFRARYIQPRLVNVSLMGLVLGVAHGAVLALAGAELAPADPPRRADIVAWCLAAAVLLNLAVAAQNLLAVMALLRLHRTSAVLAHSIRGAVQPMVWSSAALAVAAWATLHGWL
ncbi:hypothetical protein [Pseudoduganella umbonata]|uniref:Uncharacterized protein n=1 Tax=Pseudoduganella umbonata TaxID=864828 RepID=A0A4P8HQD3_9BURK|nr:hypothetical protein [Pseudoduganella umbonata]MBB3221514.1 hypothetical protein [Pseudoduganella umbonata]QCP10660.1 hypothetical protein FCL38_09615 [Pseudoduganella umbonata]